MEPMEVVLWQTGGSNRFGVVYPPEVMKEALTVFANRVNSGEITGEAKTLSEYQRTRDFNTNPARVAFQFKDCAVVGEGDTLKLTAFIQPTGPRADLVAGAGSFTFAPRGQQTTDGVKITTWDAIVPACALTEAADK